MTEAEFKREEQAEDPWEHQEVCVFCYEEVCRCDEMVEPLSECCGANIDQAGLCTHCREHAA